MEKGHIVLKKAKIDENQKNNIFLDFFRKIWKNVEKSEKQQKSQILLKKAKIDDK